MPSQILPDGGDGACSEIKVKTAYSGEVMISYIKENITYEELCFEIRKNCRFTMDQPFTIKWVDEEHDPCTISTQMELDEAIRLYEMNHNPELLIHESSSKQYSTFKMIGPNSLTTPSGFSKLIATPVRIPSTERGILPLLRQLDKY